MRSFEIISYQIFLAPNDPTENGIYYCKTPIREQALNIIKVLKENGVIAFIKCPCSDGVTRYYN